MTKRPENYQELQQEAVTQIHLKVEELLERAENLKRLATEFFAITSFETDPRRADVHPLLADVFDYDDDKDIPALRQITINWPYIASEPGEGY